MRYPILVALSYLVTSALAAQTYACDRAIKLRLRPDRIDQDRDIDSQACIDLNNGEAPFLNYKDGDLAGTISVVCSILHHFLSLSESSV
jgi:hypothetical protein